MSIENICVGCGGQIKANYNPSPNDKPSARIVCEFCSRIAEVRKLSKPPSIELRIRAAMMDEYPYQVVTYTRGEGATYAVLEIAKGNKDIFFLSHSHAKRDCREKGVNFINASRDPETFRNTTIIADVVSDSEMKKWRDRLHGLGNKIIRLKGIFTDERDGKVYVAGKELQPRIEIKQEATFEDKANKYAENFYNVGRF